MQKLSNQASWKPWMGAIWFVICLLLLIFPGAYMQSKWGMVGLLCSELLFLAASIIYTLAHKTPLKEVFPIKKISLIEFVGVIVFAIGVILANFIFVGIGMLIFPNSLSDVNDLTQFMTSGNLGFIPLCLILAVSPAVCEEAMMRGVLLSHFRGFKKEWIGIALVGVAFGIIHLSPVKFLSTGVLGAFLAYLIVKKNNILFPMIVHFTNNMVSSVAVYFMQGISSDVINQSTSVASVNSVQMFGSYLFLGFASPLLIVTGVHLMKCTKVKGKAWAIAGIMSGVFLVSGLGIVMFSTLSRPAILKSTVSYDVVEGEANRMLDFEVENEGTYIVAVTGEIGEGSIDFAIIDKETETLQTGCTEDGTFIISQNVVLEEGEYWVQFTGLDGSDNAHLSYTIQIQQVG